MFFAKKPMPLYDKLNIENKTNFFGDVLIVCVTLFNFLVAFLYNNVFSVKILMAKIMNKILILLHDSISCLYCMFE